MLKLNIVIELLIAHTDGRTSETNYLVLFA